MLRSSFEGQNNNLEIVHNNIPKNLWKQFDTIADVLILIFSLVAIQGTKYINNKFDVLITITFILVFSILQLINIYVNMRHKRPTIKMMVFIMISTNRMIGFIPFLFIIIGASTFLYPFFLGAFLFSNIFNLLLHIDINKPGYNVVNTRIENNIITIRTHFDLLGMTANWVHTFTNTDSLKIRIISTKITYGYLNSTSHLTEDNYSKLLEDPPSSVDKNLVYTIHFIETSQSGKNIKVNKDDQVTLIGETINFKDITDLISNLERITKIEYCLYLNTK